MTQRSILITGCSSGIGLDAARALHARGWRVFATCRQETDCERLRGEGLESFRLDYADEANIAEAVAEVLGKLGSGEAALMVASVDGEWARIVIQGDGMEGYVALRYLSAEAP